MYTNAKLAILFHINNNFLLFKKMEKNLVNQNIFTNFVVSNLLQIWLNITFNLKKKKMARYQTHIGPGLLVTVGFIDPGNWASTMAAGSQFGYALLWIVTLSTIMLIVLQHNAAHLGIATGACLAEATTRFLPGPSSPTKARPPR